MAHSLDDKEMKNEYADSSKHTNLQKREREAEVY